MWIRYMKYGEIVTEWQEIDEIWPDEQIATNNDPHSSVRYRN